MTSIDRPESSSGIVSSADDVLTYNYEHFWLNLSWLTCYERPMVRAWAPYRRLPTSISSPPKAAVSGWPIPEADRCCSTSAARPDRSPSAHPPSRHVSRMAFSSSFITVSVTGCTLCTLVTCSATLVRNSSLVSASACQLQVWPASFQP